MTHYSLRGVPSTFYFMWKVPNLYSIKINDLELVSQGHYMKKLK